MTGAIRYRTGINARTGKVLRGAPHLAQSLGKIWGTKLGDRVMLLTFGSRLRSLLAEDLSPALALAIYSELVVPVVNWEPEYDLRQLQFVRLTETGLLALRHSGDYYPEGRFGNRDLVVPFNASAVPLATLGTTA